MTDKAIKSTTIIGIRKNNQVVIAGDGQASFGNTVMKANGRLSNSAPPMDKSKS